MQRNLLAIALVFGLLFSFIWCRRQNKSESSRKSERLQEKVISKSQAVKPGNSFGSMRQSVEATLEKRDSVPMAPALGGAYFRDDKGRRRLGVTMAPAINCVEGEIDTMLHYKKHSGSKIILTLEPVGVGDVGKSIAMELSESDLRQGKNLVFDVSQDSPMVYGFFLCADPKGTNRCLGKRPADMAINFDNLERAYADIVEKDVVFYLQLIILKNFNFELFQGPLDLRSVADTFAAAKNKNNLDEPELQRANYITGLLKSLRPFPMTIHYDDKIPGTFLNFHLGSKDESKCIRD